MSTFPVPIETYVANIVAGEAVIGKALQYIRDARYIVSIGGNKCYTIKIPQLGTERFSASELVFLDEQAMCQTLEDIILENGNMPPTISNALKILYKAKGTYYKLFQAYYIALDRRDTGGIYCYTFVNPYGELAGVNKDKLQLVGNQIISFFDNARRKQTFNPLLFINIGP